MAIILEEDNNTIGLEGEDVVGLEYIHIECKRVERLNLEEAMNQSKRDAEENQLPAVFHRKNRQKWLVTMELDDWIKLYNEYYSSMKLVEMDTTTTTPLKLTDIDKAIEKFKQNPYVHETKIYLNSAQAQYKEYLEKEGFNVILTNNLAAGSDIIVVENKEK